MLFLIVEYLSLQKNPVIDKPSDPEQKSKPLGAVRV